MGRVFKKTKGFFDLSLSLAKAGFKLKNEGTWLGILWYLLAPMMIFLLLLGIFTDRLGQNIPNYPLYLLLGILMFNFFQKITSESIIAIKGNFGLIKSLNFPRESLVGAIILKSLFSHFFEIIILLVFLLAFKIPIKMMIFYPGILFFLVLFLFGFALILSSLTVYFIDLNNIWVFVSRLIWFATPIFYSIGGQTRLYYLNLINPMYYFITISRDIIIYSKVPELWMIMSALFFTLLSLLLGLFIFNKLKIKFAEYI